jgi:hypothetical protein
VFAGASQRVDLGPQVGDFALLLQPVVDLAAQALDLVLQALPFLARNAVGIAAAGGPAVVGGLRPQCLKFLAQAVDLLPPAAAAPILAPVRHEMPPAQRALLRG